MFNSSSYPFNQPNHHRHHHHHHNHHNQPISQSHLHHLSQLFPSPAPIINNSIDHPHPYRGTAYPSYGHHSSVLYDDDEEQQEELELSRRLEQLRSRRAQSQSQTQAQAQLQQFPKLQQIETLKQDEEIAAIAIEAKRRAIARYEVEERARILAEREAMARIRSKRQEEEIERERAIKDRQRVLVAAKAEVERKALEEYLRRMDRERYQQQQQRQIADGIAKAQAQAQAQARLILESQLHQQRELEREREREREQQQRQIALANAISEREEEQRNRVRAILEAQAHAQAQQQQRVEQRRRVQEEQARQRQQRQKQIEAAARAHAYQLQHQPRDIPRFNPSVQSQSQSQSQPQVLKEQIVKGTNAVKDVVKVRAEEEIKKFLGGLFGGLVGPVESPKEDQSQSKKMSLHPSGSDATPFVPATSSTAPATRDHNTPSAAQSKPTIEDSKDQDHSLKDVSDLLRNMFGIDVDFGGSGCGEEEKKFPESEVDSKSAKEKAVAEEPRTVVPSAKPTSTIAPATKDTENDASTDPLAEISNYLKQFGLDIQFHQPNDEPASSSPAFTTPKPASESPSSSTIPKALEQNLSGLAGDLFAAFTGALAGQRENGNTSETRKDVKGKGKAKEEVVHDRPESSAAGSGAWAGLTEQEKEESRAIERSFERAKEASLATEIAVRAQAAKEDVPTATPTKTQTQTETETATDVKPAPAQEETLRTAYNRHANRVNKLEQLDVLSNKLDKLISGFTFPFTLDFQSPSSTQSSPSLDPVSSAESIKTPSLRVPPLTFSHNNQPYHTQAQALMSLLTSADEITSDGDKAVRKARKEFVKRVEMELGRMEVARGKIWREKNEVASKSETKPVEANEVQINVKDRKTDIEAAEGYELPETTEVEENSSAGIAPVETTPITTTSSPTETNGTSDVIFEAPSSPGPTQVNDTPSHAHSSNATTVEDEPEATENVSNAGKQPDIPIVSIIEQLPPAAATAQLPKDDSSDTEESTRSFTDSEGSDSETEEKKESGKKKEDGFVLV